MEVDFMLTDAINSDTGNFRLWDKHSNNGCVMIPNMNENNSSTIQIHNLDDDNDIKNDIYTHHVQSRIKLCLFNGEYIFNK